MALERHPNMHPLAGGYTNAFELAAELQAAGVKATAKVITLNRHYAALLQARIQAKASGRPGPRAITGDYRRSWTTLFTAGFGGVSSTVGTNKPQGRRLEYGFVGTDAAGRSYNQPPYPHVGPAADETLPEYVEALVQVLDLDN